MKEEKKSNQTTKRRKKERKKETDKLREKEAVNKLRDFWRDRCGLRPKDGM